MEHVPSWLDMALVEEGARLERNASVNISPFSIRGRFIATFMNKYAALPMALTGTLSEGTAARRVNETANFFATSVLPGALDRQGPGFKAAAMVRLMHSLVRYNALRSGHWDQRVFGIPIPQVDQMPAGLVAVFLLSLKVLSQGRTSFSSSERARVEFTRYRCYLLGLPEDLLADTPQGIVDVMGTRQATLRAGYDDATCGELLRATMAAYLRPDRSLRNRVRNEFERSFSKLFFVKNFLAGNKAKAAEIGVPLKAMDYARAMVVALLVATRSSAYGVAMRLPGLRTIADRSLVRKLRRQLAEYGHAEYATDAAAYRPSFAKREPAV
jgi:hypothetical protein